ncbi:MAG: hypothetical protein Hyperionvirus9_48 [Hyperionvirus sp.]|uniref:Uncharacterized protein n=1 Tax=Hyperionvirus sp. TaxID=2487770 RepID=A0A3G5ABH4_9VIRU|nr:MAG: hypothetical protein Hyperionvirus9_48 [Hyperionvirus sp.]
MENLDYYINLLDKYYNIKPLIQLITDDITTFGSIAKLKEHTNQLSQIIIDNIKSKPAYEDFIKYKKTIPKSANIGKLYHEDNNFKLFISIDIKTANFTLARQFDPEIFDGSPTWSEYISKFSTSSFLKQSKPFREIIFGKLFGNFDTICSDTISKIIPEISSEYHLTHKSHDEAIYQIDEESLYQKLNDFISKKYPNIFHIRMFRLVRLGKKPYYIKQFSTGAVEFKCVPKKLICQCIRYYQTEPPEIHDLKFIDDDMVATYDHPIIF